MIKRKKMANLTLIITLVVVNILLIGSSVFAQVSVDFWHIWGGHREPLLKEAIAEFEKINPDIKVNPILMSNKGYKDRALTALTGGNPPDAMMVYTDLFPLAAKNGYFVDLTERVQEQNVSSNDYISGLWGMVTSGGKVYGLPQVHNGLHLLYWNKQLFKEAGLDPTAPPRTWDELEKMALELTKYNDDGDLEVVGINVMEYNFGAALMFMKYLYCNGGSLLSPDGKTVTFNSPEGKETLNYMVELAEKQGGIERIRSLQSQFLEASGSTYPFFFGKEAIITSGVYLMSMIESAVPNLDYGVAPLPVGPNGKKSKDLIMGSWNLVVPKEGKNHEAAWKLIKWLAYGKGHEMFMKAQERPAMISAYNKGDNLDYYKKNNPHWDTILKVMDSGVALPSTTVTSEMVEIIKQFTEAAIYHDKSVEEALEWGSKQVEEVIKENK